MVVGIYAYGVVVVVNDGIDGGHGQRPLGFNYEEGKRCKNARVYEKQEAIGRCVAIEDYHTCGKIPQGNRNYSKSSCTNSSSTVSESCGSI